MPLPVAHGLLGASLVAALLPRPARGRYAIPLLVGALLANAADLDFLLVFALRSKAWHRGFSHSIVFALLVCALSALLLGKQRLKETLAYGLAFASHGIVDYVTSKEGGGVELLWPFTTGRLILGWWGLSEVPSRLTRVEILEALAVEFALFTPLLLAVVLWRRAHVKDVDSTAGAS
jgi:inner membrane protein